MALVGGTVLMRGNSPEAMWFAFFSPSVSRGRSAASSGMLTGTWDGLREVGIVPNLLGVRGGCLSRGTLTLEEPTDSQPNRQTDRQAQTSKNERLPADGWLRARHD